MRMRKMNTLVFGYIGTLLTSIAAGYGVAFFFHVWAGFLITLIMNGLGGYIFWAYLKTQKKNLIQYIETGSNPSGDHHGYLGSVVDSLGALTSELQFMKAKCKGIDVALSCIMIADENNHITYCNESMISNFKKRESDLRKSLPSFNTDTLVGTSMDTFHKNPAHQKGMVAALQSSYRTKIVVGECHYSLIATPLFDENKKRMGTVVEWRDITDEVKAENDIFKLVEYVNRGDLTYRVSTHDKEGVFKKLGESMNELSETIQSVLDQTDEFLGEIASGQLTTRMEGQYEGIYESIKSNANIVAEKLFETISNINTSIDNVSTASKRIANGAQSLDERTQTQASNLEETAASIEQLSTNVKATTSTTLQALDISKQTYNAATEGETIVKDVVNAMGRIQDSSNKISEIIALINSIAFQTNLLSLNASVESARAGEQGRGFSVVAQEVRKLAENCSQASHQIKSLIEQSQLDVTQGSEMAQRASQSLEGIMKSVHKVSEMNEEINTSMAEQSSNLDQITLTVSTLDEMTQKNSSLVTQSASSVQSLDQEVNSLSHQIKFFKLTGDGAKRKTPHKTTNIDTGVDGRTLN